MAAAPWSPDGLGGLRAHRTVRSGAASAQSELSSALLLRTTRCRTTSRYGPVTLRACQSQAQCEAAAYSCRTRRWGLFWGQLKGKEHHRGQRGQLSLQLLSAAVRLGGCCEPVWLCCPPPPSLPSAAAAVRQRPRRLAAWPCPWPSRAVASLRLSWAERRRGTDPTAAHQSRAGRRGQGRRSSRCGCRSPRPPHQRTQ